MLSNSSQLLISKPNSGVVSDRHSLHLLAFALWMSVATASGKEAMEGARMERKRRVCVTGAGGFVASRLVKLLLSKGYEVHGTVRDPGDEKNAHLRKLDNSAESLHLFKADLFDYNALLSAIDGCEGVFHVASPVPSGKLSNPEEEVIAPAVIGTRNVLKACSEAKVKRVVVVSSAAAVMLNPHWPNDRAMDESCWSDKEFCRTTENFYCLSKTLAEDEAADYAKKHGLDVITLCPPFVIGPLLQSTVNASSLFLINILKEARESVENKLLAVVDVRDVADALLLVYEKPEASGRYICSTQSIKIRDLVNILKSLYPNCSCPKEFVEVDKANVLTSEKLKQLGWEGRSLEESLKDTVKCYEEAGLLTKS